MENFQFLSGRSRRSRKRLRCSAFGREGRICDRDAVARQALERVDVLEASRQMFHDRGAGIFWLARIEGWTRTTSTSS
jgi:hypothetical protein